MTGRRVRLYNAGDTFIDKGEGHVHIARNEGAGERRRRSPA